MASKLHKSSEKLTAFYLTPRKVVGISINE